MTKMKMQGRRPMPKMRNKKTAAQPETHAPNLGDLICAAYDALGDTSTVVRVLNSQKMGRVIGRKLVVG